MAFLNHEPCGMKIVVDHINYNIKDNRLVNLRLITNRENTSHRKKKGSSKYTGVCWHKQNLNWVAYIQVKGKNISLGSYKTEYEAHLAYQKALKELI